MKTYRSIVQLSLLSMVLLGSTSARAALSAHSERGQKVIEHPVTGRNPEVCVIPKHSPQAAYSDKDAVAENELCNLDEYTNAAVCPKLNSTNPGLDLYSLPKGSTPKQVEQAKCRASGAKKIAKYKLSTSCSYTPSILGYYHVSRILGGVGNVPPSVLRTFDLQNHIALGRIALSGTASTSLIHQTWSSLMGQLTEGSRASRRNLLLTDDFLQSYGALSVNPTNEQFYKEFFNGGANNVARAKNFRDTNPTVAMLARNTDIGNMVSRNFTAESLEKMVQLRDAANLIVIDTLMNQQDRFGNIHYIETYYYRDPNDLDPKGSAKLKSSTKLTPAEVAQFGAVQVKELLLKDNDCGVAKQNVAKQVGLADRISHIDPNTYRRLLALEAIADQASTKRFFIEELVFTESDYSNFRKNLSDLSTKLHQACAQGRLRLDLDLQAHFSGQPIKPQGCDS